MMISKEGRILCMPASVNLRQARKILSCKSPFENGFGGFGGCDSSLGDHVRQAGVKSGVVELVTDHAAMVAIWVGTASMVVGGVSSVMASVCM